MSPRLILITGVSGFIGFSVLAEALRRGHNVRAVIRKAEQADKIKSTESVKPYVTQLEFAVIPDLLVPGAFDNSLQGVTEVIHCASPLPSSVPGSTNYKKDIIEPAILGTTGILDAALKVSSIKRVVITSSMAAFLDMEYFMTPEPTRIYTAQDRVLPLDPDQFADNADLSYVIAKVSALNATDRFVEEKKPSFDVVNILPSLVIGKSEMDQTRKSVGVGSNNEALGLLLTKIARVDSLGASVHIDDVGRAHLDALNPELTGHRSYMCSSGGLEGTVWEDAKDIARKHFPKYVEDGTLPLAGTNPTKQIRLDSSETEKTFGWKFLNYEEQVKSLIGHYVSLPAAK